MWGTVHSFQCTHQSPVCLIHQHAATLTVVKPGSHVSEERREEAVKQTSKMAATIAASAWGTLLRIPRGFGASGFILPQSCIHTTTMLEKRKKWEVKNKQVYLPQLPEEPRRAAEIFHCRRGIKYSKDKMWYLAKLIRGMSIDQAIAQLEFNDKKGAKIIKEVLLEAQDLAVRNNNVEYKSNLYVEQSFSNKGKYLKRIRYHGRGMFGIMDKVYCHYFVKLVEGPPPPQEPPVTGFQQAKDYVQQLKNRTIIHSL